MPSPAPVPAAPVPPPVPPPPGPAPLPRRPAQPPPRSGAGRSPSPCTSPRCSTAPRSASPGCRRPAAGITPAQLSVFVLVQLGVYAAMQVPTGLLVDRYGPRRLLVAAAVTMALAQLAFALTRSYPVALLARGVLGCGDALTFVSVVRVAAQDFPRHRFPLAVSVTSMLGMAGNLAATIPLTLLLRSAGWTLSFAGTGLVSLVTGVAVWALLPAGRPTAAPRQHGAAAHRNQCRSARARPGGRCTGCTRPGAPRAPGSASGCISPACRWPPCSPCCGACPTWSGRASPKPGRAPCCWSACWPPSWPAQSSARSSAATRPPGCRSRSASAWSPWPAGRCCWAASAGGRRTR